MPTTANNTKTRRDVPHNIRRGLRLNRQARAAGLCLVAVDGAIQVPGYQRLVHEPPKELLDELLCHQHDVGAALQWIAASADTIDHRNAQQLEYLDAKLSACRKTLDAKLMAHEVTDECWCALSALIEDMGLICRNLHTSLDGGHL